MTTEEKDAQLGRDMRNLKQARLELACRERKLRGFREQLEAVITDWHRLEIANKESLYVGILGKDYDCFRSVPSEADIVSVKLEIDHWKARVEQLQRDVDDQQP